MDEYISDSGVLSISEGDRNSIERRMVQSRCCHGKIGCNSYIALVSVLALIPNMILCGCKYICVFSVVRNR